KVRCEVFHIDHRQQFLDRFRTHLRDELCWIVTNEFAITLVADQLALFQPWYVAWIDDDVRLEVENLFEFAEWNIKQVTDAARQSLEEPDVRTGTREID